MFGHFVVDEGYRREILVHDRPELLQTERLDDVRRGNHAHHARRGKPTDGHAARGRVRILVKDE